MPLGIYTFGVFTMSSLILGFLALIGIIYIVFPRTSREMGHKFWLNMILLFVLMCLTLAAAYVFITDVVAYGNLGQRIRGAFWLILLGIGTYIKLRRVVSFTEEVKRHEKWSQNKASLFLLSYFVVFAPVAFVTTIFVVYLILKPFV